MTGYTTMMRMLVWSTLRRTICHNARDLTTTRARSDPFFLPLLQCLTESHRKSTGRPSWWSHDQPFPRVADWSRIGRSRQLLNRILTPMLTTWWPWRGQWPPRKTPRTIIRTVTVPLAWVRTARGWEERPENRRQPPHKNPLRRLQQLNLPVSQLLRRRYLLPSSPQPPWLRHLLLLQSSKMDLRSPMNLNRPNFRDSERTNSTITGAEMLM